MCNIGTPIAVTKTNTTLIFLYRLCKGNICNISPGWMETLDLAESNNKAMRRVGRSEWSYSYCEAL